MTIHNAIATLGLLASLIGLPGLAGAASGPGHEHDAHADHGQHVMGGAQASAADTDALRAIVAAIESGWETGSATPFRDNYVADADAYYVEGGGADVGLEHFVTHHVIPEGEVLADIELNLVPLSIDVRGDLAWLVASSEFRARVRSDDRLIHSTGFETIVFERVMGAWKVVHTHGSSRPVK